MKDQALLILMLVLTVFGAASPAQQGEKTREREQLDFSMEQEIVPIQQPVTLSKGALKVLEKEADVSSCMENAKLSAGQLPNSWFVGSQVHLDGPDEIDLIVLPSQLKATQPMHPVPNACFFGPYTTKFWVLRMSMKGFELVLSVNAHDLGVRKTSWERHRDIEASVSSLNGTTTSIFRFDGQQYRLQKENAAPSR
jgi:hypothetical protein